MAEQEASDDQIAALQKEIGEALQKVECNFDRYEALLGFVIQMYKYAPDDVKPQLDSINVQAFKQMSLDLVEISESDYLNLRAKAIEKVLLS